VFTGGVLLANQYKTQNPIGWWMSEKYDGYRAMWDGQDLRTRTGNIINAPQWFLGILPPSIALDGELYKGRGKFQDCGVFRRKVVNDTDWLDVTYHVFDVPSYNKPFEERIYYLQQLIQERCSYMKIFKVPINICPIIMIDFIKITSQNQFDTFYNDIITAGGEGVMLRKPGSLYEKKRSSTLLKVKSFTDAECKITCKPGSGKYAGLLGAFKCKYNNSEFHLSGMTDDVRHSYKTSHPIGTIITFKYMGLSNPRHPVYLRKYISND